MAVIVPEAGRFAEVFAALSALVADPKRDIRATTDTALLGLVVSDEVYDRYMEGDTTPAPKRRTRRNLADQEEQS